MFLCAPIRASRARCRATWPRDRRAPCDCPGEPDLDTSLMLFPSSLPLLWALEFANPGLLAGLAAASIPIVIHRLKFREMPWAAMQFLMAAIRKNQRRVRIEQWLLLAVRTLLLMLIAAAMAKPFLESFGNVIAGQRTHRVLILDSSLSMGYTTGDKSRFDLAKDVA